MPRQHRRPVWKKQKGYVLQRMDKSKAEKDREISFFYHRKLSQAAYNKAGMMEELKPYPWLATTLLRSGA